MALTRGGAQLWYPGFDVAPDLLSLRSPRDIRIETARQHARTGLLKQRHLTAWDERVCREAAPTAMILHPSIMYRGLAPYWEGRRGLAWLLPHLDLTPIRVAGDKPADLPDSYVVVQFYARATWPYHPETLALAHAIIRRLAETTKVVLIGQAEHYDDHVTFPPLVHPHVSVVSTGPPVDNLSRLSLILRGARGFVGTYGGVAQLALRMGIPSVSFLTTWQGTAIQHRHLSEVVGVLTNTPCTVVLAQDINRLLASLPTAFLSSSGGPWPALKAQS
jgi:hypothetical protein